MYYESFPKYFLHWLDWVLILHQRCSSTFLESLVSSPNDGSRQIFRSGEMVLDWRNIQLSKREPGLDGCGNVFDGFVKELQFLWQMKTGHRMNIEREF